jgi:NAD(P)-dependent dehydrogenase (short-subunit alcohol dehydrogenase family)
MRLKRSGGEVDFAPLDVASSESIVRFAEWVSTEYGRLDVLVNNAGILPDSAKEHGSHSAFQIPIDVLRRAMETNVYGPYQLMQRLLPLMMRARYGRVINLSSEMGQLTGMNGGYPAYRVSKASLNALTRIFSDELQGSGVSVNSVSPGWVRTEMGGPNAELSVEQGADTIVWLATMEEGCPTGGFFRDQKPIAW